MEHTPHWLSASLVYLAAGSADVLPNCPRAIAALGLGALWGAMAWLVADGVDWRQIVALAVLSHAACVANMAWLARWPGAYSVLTMLALAPVIVRAALLPTAHGPALAGQPAGQVGGQGALAHAALGVGDHDHRHGLSPVSRG